MSFKGFKKSIVRAPQQLRQKMNMGEVTHDPVYQDAEVRFKEIEVETKKLSEESSRYFKAINAMLDEQIEFARAMEDIYKPIAGGMAEPDAQEDSPEGLESAEYYRAAMSQLKEELKPDLELIEKRVVAPAQELLKVINNIRKMATKREHKKVDLDRHKRSLAKYQSKKEPTVKDEERMYNSQADVETAQAEFDYYNELMKQELPQLFEMQTQFIHPLFVLFYYMQLNIYYTLYIKMEELKMPHFDLSLDIVEGYNAKKGDAEARAESLGIAHFKVGHAKRKLETVRRNQELRLGQTPSPGTSTPASPVVGAPGVAGAEAGAAAGQLPAYSPGTYGNQYGTDQKATYNPAGVDQKAAYNPAAPAAAAAATPAYGQAPAYGQPAAQAPAYGQPAAQAPAYGQPAATPAYAQPAAVPPPPPAAPAAAPAATCTALYDYTAQAAGDLTFPAGAVIEIVERTADANGWWTGRYNGQQGVFPGNYVQLN